MPVEAEPVVAFEPATPIRKMSRPTPTAAVEAVSNEAELAESSADLDASRAGLAASRADLVASRAVALGMAEALLGMAEALAPAVGQRDHQGNHQWRTGPAIRRTASFPKDLPNCFPETRCTAESGAA